MMNLSSLSDQQLLAMAKQQGINVQKQSAPVPQANNDLSSLSDDQLLQMAKSQGINVVPENQFKQLDNIQSGLTLSNLPSLPNMARDVAGGIANGVGDLLNFPNTLANYFSPGQTSVPKLAPYNNVGNVFLPKNQNDVDKNIQNIGVYAPFMLGGEAALGAEAAPGLLARTATQAGANFAGGAASNPTDPISQGVQAALLGTAFNAGGELAAGNLNPKNLIGNFILNRANKAMNAGSALNPQEAAENLATNYTDAQGNPLNVDLGTLINNQSLKNVYGGLGNIPFTGVNDARNAIQNKIFDKKIGQAQTDLEDYQAKAPTPPPQLSAEDIPLSPLRQSYISDLQANLAALNKQNEDLVNYTSQPSMSLQSDIVPDLQNKQSDLDNLSQGLAQQINSAPSLLDSLKNDVDNPNKISSAISAQVKKTYEDNKEEARSLYAPLNNSSYRLDTLGIDDPFPNYRHAATELMVQRENLGNLFDSTSDLGSPLSSEIAKADAFLNPDKENDIDAGMNLAPTLGDMMSRSRAIGDKAADAFKSGDYNTHRLLSGLKDGLDTDIDTVLRNSGRADLANKLADAKSFYSNNVANFWDNPAIKKVVTRGKVAPQATLASALHDPNNESILNQIPQNIKNASLYQLLTKGTGEIPSADVLASRWSSLGQEAKNSIQKYNPDAFNLFSGLKDALAKKSLTDAQYKQNQSLIESLQSQSDKNSIKNASDKQKADQKLQDALTKNSLNRQKTLNSLQKQYLRAQSEKQSQLESMQSKFNSDKSQYDKGLQNLQTALVNLKNKKYGANSYASGIANKIPGLLAEGGAGLAAAYLHPALAATLPLFNLGARSLAKTLASPELRNAYLNQTRMPLNAALAQTLARYGNAAITPQVSGGQ